jgi:uncharacterized pyridoxal phosphate-containing UPF0001 family protein
MTNPLTTISKKLIKQLAIQNGATFVRVGSDIFGKRD